MVRSSADSSSRSAARAIRKCRACAAALRKRDGRDLDGFAGDGRALIGDARGIAEHDDDARKGHVEFLGDDLSERGANAGAEIDMAVEGGDRTVGRDPDEGFEPAFLAAGGGANDGQ